MSVNDFCLKSRSSLILKAIKSQDNIISKSLRLTLVESEIKLVDADLTELREGVRNNALKIKYFGMIFTGK